MKVAFTLKTAVAAVALTAGALAATQGAAQAANDTPLKGELCQARENIQFYDDYGNPSYVVAANGNIRIDSDRNESAVYGHGENHSTRVFTWRHTTGAYRLKNCH